MQETIRREEKQDNEMNIPILLRRIANTLQETGYYSKRDILALTKYLRVAFPDKYTLCGLLQQSLQRVEKFKKKTREGKIPVSEATIFPTSMFMEHDTMINPIRIPRITPITKINPAHTYIEVYVANEYAKLFHPTNIDSLGRKTAVIVDPRRLKRTNVDIVALLIDTETMEGYVEEYNYIVKINKNLLEEITPGITNFKIIFYGGKDTHLAEISDTIYSSLDSNDTLRAKIRTKYAAHLFFKDAETILINTSSDDSSFFRLPLFDIVMPEKYRIISTSIGPLMTRKPIRGIPATYQLPFLNAYYYESVPVTAFNIIEGPVNINGLYLAKAPEVEGAWHTMKNFRVASFLFYDFRKHHKNLPKLLRRTRGLLAIQLPVSLDYLYYYTVPRWF